MNLGKLMSLSSIPPNMNIKFNYQGEAFNIELNANSDGELLIGNIKYAVTQKEDQLKIFKEVLSSISLESITSMKDLTEKLAAFKGISDLSVTSKTTEVGTNILSSSRASAIERKMRAAEEVTGVKLKLSEEIVNGSEAAKIDTYIQALTENANFRGSVIVLRDDKPILSKGYGVSKETSSCIVRNSPSTIFQIASLTKQFTAAAIMKLVEEDKINLNKPINDFLPERFRSEVWKDVTVDQLLSHTAGIPDYTKAEDYLKTNHELSVDKIIQEASRKPLQFAPGTKFEYSNTGYTLLGAIIEEQSKLSYGEFLKQKIFMPAGMESSGVHDESYSAGPNAAIGYCSDENGEKLIRDQSEKVSITFSDGAVYSTVEDLASWSKVLNGKGRQHVLKEKSIQAMTTPGKLDIFGYGLKIDESYGKKRIHHNGAIAGFKTNFCMYPNDGLYIAVLCNNASFSADRLSNDITKIIFDTKEEVATPIPFPKSFDYTPYLGNFQSELFKDFQFTFLLTDEGRLLMKGSHMHPAECILLKNKRLFNSSIELELKEGKLLVFDDLGNQFDTLDRPILLE